jgi:hypothetical protein
MEGVSEILAGFQQSLLPEVEAYWLGNTPEQKFQVGDQVRLRQGRFYHHRITTDVGEVGYYNGGSYRVLCGKGDRGDWYREDALERITPEQPKQKRVQVGWIEERRANPSRDNPTTCYYFGWYEVVEGERRKFKVYVPQHQMSEIWRMVKTEKRPYYETLRVIRKHEKLRHTPAPMPKFRPVAHS